MFDIVFHFLYCLFIYYFFSYIVRQFSQIDLFKFLSQKWISIKKMTKITSFYFENFNFNFLFYKFKTLSLKLYPLTLNPKSRLVNPRV